MPITIVQGNAGAGNPSSTSAKGYDKDKEKEKAMNFARGAYLTGQSEMEELFSLKVYRNKNSHDQVRCTIPTLTGVVPDIFGFSGSQL